MPTTKFAQGRMMRVNTPLGKDVLLLEGFSGMEQLSGLFRFTLDLLADKAKKVEFDQLLGKELTVEFRVGDGESESKKRYFSGICSRFSELGRDYDVTRYQAEIVPQLWLLTRRAQSRIFQHQSVPDILKKVLDGLDVEYQISGTFEPRDYCVQYRETDFNFASRLMEEEGIFYFFKFSESSHKLVVGNSPPVHPDVPAVKEVRYEVLEGGERRTPHVRHWTKAQEIRSGKVTLWDHHFELPGKNLEAQKTTADSVAAGTVTHKLKVANNSSLEIYDYPGEYAQRFDGIDKGGGEKPSNVQKVFQDNSRTAGLRMEAETAAAVIIRGLSNCNQFTAGHKFNLQRHFNAQGGYVLTSIQHEAYGGTNYRSGSDEFDYNNHFTCIPAAMPYRPARLTPAPTVMGVQTATVVGPSGQEIFTDKYGRVKVQFNWDRDGKHDADSSCWLRVVTGIAGDNWGMIHIPRIGQEVLVDFIDGDPDAPIIIGGVYNAGTMPPYKLPDNKTQSGIKTRSSMSGTPENFNEIRFEDKKGEEEVYIHAEKNMNRVVENNDTLKVGSSKAPDGSQTVNIYKDRTHTVETGNEILQVDKGNRDVLISMGNDTHIIKQGNRDVVLEMGSDSLTIKMGNRLTKLSLGKSETEAMQSIELKVGQSSVKLDQSGVTIKGLLVKVEGTVQTQVKAPITMVDGSGMLKLSGGITMIG